DRQLVDVALERAAGQQVAGDVVEPDALAFLVERFGCPHLLSPSGVMTRPPSARRFGSSPFLGPRRESIPAATRRPVRSTFRCWPASASCPARSRAGSCGLPCPD